jgi:tRNA/rRNA methyltransferase
MNNLRLFFSRLQLKAKEVQIIRGICRQIDWYGNQRYQDGLRERKASGLSKTKVDPNS